MNKLQRQSGGLFRPIGNKLVEQLFSGEFNDQHILQLTIKFASENVNVNELASYFGAIYKVDGLLHSSGYRSYVRNFEQQIEFTRIQSGSIVTEIQRIITSPDAYNLVGICLFLRYLQQGVHKIIETTGAYYDTLNKREDYLEKRENRKTRERENRARRRELKKAVAEDKELAQLSDNDRAKLVDLVDQLCRKNSAKLNAIVRFSEKYVKSISLKSQKK